MLLKHDDKGVQSLSVETIGATSAAQTLSYLDNGCAVSSDNSLSMTIAVRRHVYVGSHHGDSVLVRLRKEKDEKGSNVEVQLVALR